jgi:hypothetical protein
MLRKKGERGKESRGGNIQRGGVREVKRENIRYHGGTI